MTGRSTVLAYHAVGECRREDDRFNLFIDRDTFAAQMEFLARRRSVVTLMDVLGNRSTPRPAVAITFDDAYGNVLANAAPILAAHGFPATLFVPTAWTGRDAGWLEASPCDLRVMDEAELRRTMELGFTLESHGDRHAHMTTLSDADARSDVTESTERVRAITGRRPSFFAYPYGEVSPRLERIVREAGYTAAFGIDRPGVGPFAYERTQITRLDGRAVFAAKTSGRYLSVRHAATTRAAYRVAKPLVTRLLRRQSPRPAGSTSGSGSQSDAE